MINFWKSKEFIASAHFDVEAVVGVKVQDLVKVFKNSFGHKTEPMDVAIVGGINNVGERQPETDTLKEFANFQSIIYDHSIKHKHVDNGFGKNSVSISPILIPPKFASFSAPQNIPQNFENKLAHIENLNTALIGLNRCFGERTCVWINTYGVRAKKGKKNPTE